MKIHEFQAKKILNDYNIDIQRGHILESTSQIDSILSIVEKDFSAQQFIIKAQVHAGGRGKAGGVKFSSNKTQAKDNINAILGMQLKTHQTAKEGVLVNKVMVTESIDIDKEYYVAIALDRSKRKNVFMVSSEGGVDIEDLAKTNPEAIVKVWIDSAIGIQSFQLNHLVNTLGLKDNLKKQCLFFFKQLYRCYEETDASIVEINPLVLTKQEKIIALDAKFNFDDNALYRQQDIAKMRDINEEDPSETQASRYNLNYVKLEGNVGCMVNGAGLAMATMDIIKQKGAFPANFLDVGGGANVETVKNGFKIILSDVNVKSILINIFGGIVRCDRVANGIIAAVKELELNIPVVVRLQGTNSEEAKEILQNSGLTLISADTLDDAAQKVVQMTK